MKKITILFIMSIISISVFANSTSLEYGDPENSITVEINPVNEPSTTMEFSFVTPQELYNFDIESKINEMKWGELKGDLCTASLTVTVSVGAARTYASATVTVEGIACGEIAATVKTLRAQLKEALK